jgi:CubicO group peptidase (beta-lactamase class C family)
VKMFRLSTIIMLLVTAFVPVVHAQNANPFADAITKIDSVITDFTTRDIFSGAVLIAKDEDILLSKGYGLANREWDIPNTPQTKFLIGSVTKQFTAMGILLLQEEGKLNVQDLICQYITDCPDAWKDITIFHLLTHTSGIPDYINGVPNFRAITQREETTPQQLIRGFMEKDLSFKPGSQWSYSNSGYVLLGYIIDQVAPKTYPRFLADAIFKPLELNNTSYDFDGSVVKQFAQGYISPTTKAALFDISEAYADGDLYSTVEDLHRWNQLLFSGKVVKGDMLDALSKAAVSTGQSAPFDKYAFGLFTTIEQGHPVIWHPGGAAGFAAVMAYLPDEKMSIVILSNSQNSQLDQIYPVVLKSILDVQ